VPRKGRSRVTQADLLVPGGGRTPTIARIGGFGVSEENRKYMINKGK
jgi:hypothetical protein